MESVIRQIVPRSSPDIAAAIGVGGATFSLKRNGGSSSASATTGPFCKRYSETVGEVTTLYLLGGVVSGGVGNEVVADIELADVGSEPVDGTHVYLTVSFTAYVEDDVLLPGGDVTAVSSGSGTTLPDNVVPTSVATSGTLIISLGQWANGVFTPAGCGNIAVSHCLGSLSHGRL